MSNLISFVENILKILPYSPERIVARRILPEDIICDAGCGEGNFYYRIVRKKKIKNFCIGCDIFLPSLILAKEKNIYKGLVTADIRFLPFKPRQFDVVIASHVIEHLEKDKILEKLEIIPKRLLIIFVPNEYVPFSFEDEIPNVYQRHRSGYIAEDFKHRDFFVRGIGCRFICNKWYKEGKLPVWLRRCFSALSSLLTCITYFYPRLADHLFCIKYFDR